MIELMFLKEFMLARQANQKSVIFVTIFFFFFNKGFKFQTHVCNRFHDLLMTSINLSNIAILKIKNADYHCIITVISKSEAINLIKNIDLTEKSEIL